MEVDEITVLYPDCPGGLTFGPVTVQTPYEDAAEARDELPVTLTPRRQRFLGILWYVERYRTRGVFTVARDHICFRPTASVLLERAAWWRRAGCRLLNYWRPRRHARREHTAPDR